MRKLILTLAALAAVGIALPVATTQPADAATVVIKKDRGHHYGWRNHHRDRIVVRERHRDRRVIVREGHRHHGATMGVTVR